MSHLTKTAKKTYLGLVCANICIVFAMVVLGYYFDDVNLKPVVPPVHVRAIGKLVHKLQTNPASVWSKMVGQLSIPWTKMTLSQTPSYPDNAWIGFQPLIAFDLLKHHQQLEISVLIKESHWLNISMKPPLPNPYGLWITVISL